MTNVTNYLKEIKNKPFELGTHDCFIFTNQCWKLMYGKPWYDLDDSDYFTFVDEIKKTYGSVDNAISTVLSVSDRPVKGGLVTLPLKKTKPLNKSLGICLGVNSAFVGLNKLHIIKTRYVERCWINA